MIKFSSLFKSASEQGSPPLPNPGPESLPEPPPQANNYILVILDSCRWDSFVQAQPTTALALGDPEPRWSYASWTAPSHYNLLMGLLPHTSPPQVFASQLYQQEYAAYNRRLHVEGIAFQKLLPQLYLPTFLKHTLGYRTRALVSLPVLNPKTLLNHDFDSYDLMPTHNDLAGMIDRLQFDPQRPTFYLLNVGETHYPYALPTEDPSQFPRVSGLHGALKRMGDPGTDAPFFLPEQMQAMHQRQIRTVQYVDTLLEKLFDVVPPRTFITITADHGELFGEDGYFGHGPIHHEKVWQVPFLEGQIR
ncbi:MAG: sulfatase-like hydrolase/transferase [Synechococcales cyanobacterium]